MGTINSAFSIISGALDADQSALSIVANNVANANTTGYTREIPNWQQNTPITINGVSYGTGVTETGPTSVRDSVLEERLAQQQQVASASGARLTALNTLEALFPPDSGSSSSTAGDIGSDITSFFNSFSSLEGNSTDNALRQQVLSTASTLAGDISNAAASIDAQQSALDQEAVGVGTQVNSLTSAIAQLDQQIQSASPSAASGTLEDQRDQDFSALSQLIGVNRVTTQNSGTQNSGISITTTSGQLLVAGSQSIPLTTGTVNGVTHFFVGTTDVTSQLMSGGGQLGGDIEARDQDLPTALSALDQLAYGISTSVNAQNNSGTNLDGVEGTGTNSAGVKGTGTTPLYIFSQPTQIAGSALSMSVVMNDPNQISAAGLGNGTGDDSNAVSMASLQTQSLTLPTATTSLSFAQNLSSATSTAAPSNTVTGSMDLYDSLGNSHMATVTYTNQGGGRWNYSIALADQLKADTSVAGQVSYTFGAGETVDPGTNLTITGMTGSGTPATITAPSLSPGEAVGNATTGYVQTLDNALTAAGITGVTVTNTGGVLTIAGATAANGNVIADAAASANANGTLLFDVNGNLTSPATNVNGIAFSGLSNGATALNLDWQLFSATGSSNVTQTPAASAQLAQSQNGAVTVSASPINSYSSFVSQLGSTVSEVRTENTAQNASVTQLQSQESALSGVNMNDEAASLQLFEQSYQAASQVFTVLNTVMQSALNLGVETTVS